MNTADAIQAMRSGDWHGLVNALDVDERDTVTLPSGAPVDVVRIGQSILTVPTGGNDGYGDLPIFVNTVPCGHESCAHRTFMDTVEAGRIISQQVSDTQKQLAALGNPSTLPMGFSV